MKPEDLIIKLESFAHNGEEWVDELLQNIDLVKDRLELGFDIQGKKKSKKFNKDYPAYKDYITYD
jgi:hypothetical protein